MAKKKAPAKKTVARKATVKSMKAVASPSSDGKGKYGKRKIPVKITIMAELESGPDEGGGGPVG